MAIWLLQVDECARRVDLKLYGRHKPIQACPYGVQVELDAGPTFFGLVVFPPIIIAQGWQDLFEDHLYLLQGFFIEFMKKQHAPK